MKVVRRLALVWLLKLFNKCYFVIDFAWVFGKINPFRSFGLMSLFYGVLMW